MPAPDPTPNAPRRLLRRVRLLAACLSMALGTVGAARAHQPAGESPPDSARTAAAVVAGIVHYTRWPTEIPAVRLCTLGDGDAVAELHEAGDLGTARDPVPVRAVASADEARARCDALYVGTMPASSAREVLRRVAGRPLLVIGEGLEFCTDGGMFCLQGAPAAVRFAANLDALSRSGLRVNPWVLRMARPGRAKVAP